MYINVDVMSKLYYLIRTYFFLYKHDLKILKMFKV